MRKTLGWVAALGACLLVALPVQAQQQRGGRGGMTGGMGMGGPMLMGMPQVQEELKLDETQRAKVQEAMATIREGMEGMREEMASLEPEARLQKMRSWVEQAGTDVKEKLKDTLTADQWKRLEQIETQVAGPEAFARESVRKALSLTQEQAEKVDALLKSHAEELSKMMAQARADGNFADAMTRSRELRNKVRDEISGLMTEEQKSAFKELIGSPFEMARGAGRGPGASN